MPLCKAQVSLSLSLSLSLCACLSVRPCFFLSLFLPLHLPLCLSVWLSLSLCVCMSVSVSFSLSPFPFSQTLQTHCKMCNPLSNTNRQLLFPSKISIGHTFAIWCNVQKWEMMRKGGRIKSFKFFWRIEVYANFNTPSKYFFSEVTKFTLKNIIICLMF